MACPTPIMEQESGFLTLLEGVTTYRLDEQLRLETADGGALVFRLQDS
jgi:heat shock protein HslJ